MQVSSSDWSCLNAIYIVPNIYRALEFSKPYQCKWRYMDGLWLCVYWACNKHWVWCSQISVQSNFITGPMPDSVFLLALGVGEGTKMALMAEWLSTVYKLTISLGLLLAMTPPTVQVENTETKSCPSCTIL